MSTEYELGDIIVQIGDTQKWVVHGIQHFVDECNPNGFAMEYSLWRIVEREPRFWMEEEMPMAMEINGWEAHRSWVKVGNANKKDEDDDD